MFIKVTPDGSYPDIVIINVNAIESISPNRNGTTEILPIGTDESWTVLERISEVQKLIEEATGKKVASFED